MILNVILAMVISFTFAAEEKSPANVVGSLLAQQEENIFKLGQGHYQKYCIACHAASNIMVSSPKFADKNDWGARLTAAKNIQGLVKSANKGKGAMPVKGLCTECKDKDLQAAILYMMRGQE